MAKDPLDEFIDHIACTDTDAGSGEALLFTRRIPSGFVPLGESSQISGSDRGNIIMAFIQKHNTNTLEKNMPYSMPVLIEEGDRATEDLVQKILDDEKFLKKVADKIAESMSQRGRGVPA
ncbi:hypothetical protein [Methanoregula formicica]|uniref:Uncharacterized protein n=1 Tax=Methanoregula formicica (strain DSM 22288 / NBRC 105244 / SMSP) TaxID=593750 RepID=L0HCD5_METFS|nr:hypothetical protein [Methanoregula formicica]AGB02407.1 hypothetical protein Metfor_1368 [Methanoregula formicica SMSP]